MASRRRDIRRRMSVDGTFRTGSDPDFRGLTGVVVRGCVRAGESGGSWRFRQTGKAVDLSFHVPEPVSPNLYWLSEFDLPTHRRGDTNQLTMGRGRPDSLSLVAWTSDSPDAAAAHAMRTTNLESPVGANVKSRIIWQPPDGHALVPLDLQAAVLVTPVDAGHVEKWRNPNVDRPLRVDNVYLCVSRGTASDGDEVSLTLGGVGCNRRPWCSSKPFSCNSREGDGRDIDVEVFVVGTSEPGRSKEHAFSDP